MSQARLNLATHVSMQRRPASLSRRLGKSLEPQDLARRSTLTSGDLHLFEVLEELSIMLHSQMIILAGLTLLSYDSNPTLLMRTQHLKPGSTRSFAFRLNGFDPTEVVNIWMENSLVILKLVERNEDSPYTIPPNTMESQNA